jgi:hypothetical protein
MMGVWFPEGFCDDECEGINVTLDELVACTAPGVPAGCTPAPLGTLLDIYGNFLRVTLSGDDPDWETPDAPIVGICAPAGTETLLQGLRIGHQDDGTSNTEGFTILDLVAIPSELDALLICDTYAANDAAPQTFFASVLTRVSNFLLPAKAVANPLMIGGLGIGGASRSFSPFGIINTTLGATGGSTGGLKSSFTPSHPDAPALATDADGNLADSADTQQLTSLPGVSVKTGLGTAIPGATVTFTMTTPVTLTPESEASVCDVNGATQTEIVVETDANGFAGLGCVNFGSVVGFKNLKATIDPSTADGVSDVDGIDQITVAACDPQCGVPEATTELNWKVETTPGNPASLSLDPALVTTAAAGAAFSPQPIVKVLDRNGNVVTGSNLTVTASATPPSGGAGGLVGTTTEQASSGVANFTGNGLGVGGTVGSWQLSFGSGALTPATANIDITAGTAFEILTYPGLAGLFTYTTGLTPGSAVSPAPRVIVRDAYQNPVNNVALLWSPPTGANGAVLNDAGGTSTGTDGTPRSHRGPWATA